MDPINSIKTVPGRVVLQEFLWSIQLAQRIADNDRCDVGEEIVTSEWSFSGASYSISGGYLKLMMIKQ